MRLGAYYMKWTVIFHEDFEPEFDEPPTNVQDELYAEAGFVEKFGLDPKRRAILLVAGDKTGVSEKKFYKRLIAKADARYGQHLEKLKAEARKRR
jgi:hypothetical protein